MATVISSLANKLAFRWIPSLMWWVILVSCIPLVVLVFIQVWLRYVFHVPMLWVEEIAVTPAFWFYMMGAAYAVYERSHITVDIVAVMVRRPKRRLTIRFISALITLGLAMLFVYWGYYFFVWDLQMNMETATLRYPMIYGRCSIFFAAGILGGFYFWVETIDLARQLFWGKAPLFERKVE
ncbi:MAG: TRAP transporter small permease [Dehalococcoidales bacterium]